jgi:AraC-like DNA-binding protein
MFWAGAEIRSEDIALFNSGDTYRSRMSGPTRWGSISLPGNDMEQMCAAYFGHRAEWMSGCAVITPPPRALAHLRSLHAAVGGLVEASPESNISPESECALEQALVQAMLECIDVPCVRSETTAMQHHRLIIRRFCEMLDMHPLKPLYVPEASNAIGVSGRTLRMACQEHLGVSPTQYLMLRRMRLARRALRQADPDLTRVTDVATGLGFWELGRFSVKYRQIFGESPSTTLRAAGSPSRQTNLSDYAFA